MAGPGVEAAVGDRSFRAFVKRNAETGLIEPRGDLATVDEDLVTAVAHDIARHAQHPFTEELRAFSEMHFDELARPGLAEDQAPALDPRMLFAPERPVGQARPALRRATGRAKV